jgi:hypothetical protein
LSHRNLIWNILARLGLVDADPNDLLLSFLPVSDTLDKGG